MGTQTTLGYYYSIFTERVRRLEVKLPDKVYIVSYTLEFNSRGLVLNQHTIYLESLGPQRWLRQTIWIWFLESTHKTVYGGMHLWPQNSYNWMGGWGRRTVQNLEGSSVSKQSFCRIWDNLTESPRARFWILWLGIEGIRPRETLSQ